MWKNLVRLRLIIYKSRKIRFSMDFTQLVFERRRLEDTQG